MATKKEAYLFLSAMLRAREPKMLTSDKCQRMLDAPGADDAAKLLSECGYPDLSGANAAAIERALGEKRAEIFAELERMAPEKEIPAVFKMKYDYHNAKTILKAEAMELSAADTLSAAGRLSGEKLQNLYMEGRFSEIPTVLCKAMQEAKAVLARSGNPQLADFVLDRAYFAELKAAAAAVDNKFFKGYIALLIDSANLRAAVRTMRMGKGEDFLRTALNEGGSISLMRYFNADRDAITALFAHTPLEKAAVLGAQAVSGGRLTDFERECDNAVNAYLKDAKLVAFGPEPLVAYLAAVEGELTCVRMILTGRLSGISTKVIQERLRELYA